MASTAPTLVWTSLVGTALSEKFELAELLEVRGDSAIFRVLRRDAGDTEATACLWYGDSTAAGELVEFWESAREVRNQHLSSALAVGWLPQRGLLYAVMESPDERLDQVLRERPLDEEETAEVLRSILSALEEIHERGLVHGAISPEQVFTVGDVIKITNLDGCVPVRYYAPESEGENWTAEADVWCLGATLFETLTQHRGGAEARAEAARLPAPFNRILEGCLDPDPRERLTLPEIAALQRGETIARRTATAVAAPRSIAGWLYAAAGLLLLLVVVLLAVGAWRRGVERNREARSRALTAQTDTGGAGRVAQPSGPAVNVTPSANTAPIVTPSAKAAPIVAPAPGAETRDPSVWRVVLYTFDKQGAAEHRARTLNARRPKLDAKVFAPYGDRGPFLVVAGDAMTRDEASRERRRAVGMGMPRDTYIQNY